MKKAVKRIYDIDHDFGYEVLLRWRQSGKAFRMLRRTGWDWNYYTWVFVGVSR